jgi:Protein of unknown function (DUF3300)
MKPTSSLLLALLVSVSSGFEFPTARAQEPAPPAGASPEAAPPPSAPALRSAAELEKLAMPIALHPDPLIAVVLPASVYPVEIVQAARFVKNTNNISKVDEQPWDDSVKAVAKFPDMIAKMDADLGWTVALGQAFLDQPKELMDTIQALRAKAHKAGTLQSNPQQIVTVTNVVIIQTNVTQVVTVTNHIVEVQPSNPQVVYVPSYPPTVYYPPPAYVYNPMAPLVTFGVGMAWGAVLANNCNWNHGEVDVDIDKNVNINRPDKPDRSTSQSGNRASSTGAKSSQQKWKPDQSRMRTSGAPSAQTREARGWGGGSSQPGQRPATGGGGARPSTGAAGARPAAQPSSRGSGGGARPSAAQQPSGNRSGPSGAGGARPSPSSYNRSSSSSAFSGVNSGGGARNSSSRGASSRGGGGGGMRGGGGRR